MADPESDQIFKILKSYFDEEITEIKKHYVIESIALHKKVGEELRLVIPKDAR